MKHMKIVEVPASTQEVVDFETCDLCGGKISVRGYNVDDVEVRHRTGSNYPEGGSGDETSVDLCGSCFDEKLIPWLKLQGVNPHVEDWSW